MPAMNKRPDSRASRLFHVHGPSAESNWPKRIAVSVAIFLGIALVASVGYRIIEPNYTWLDSVHMAAITITTVGFAEVGGTLSSAGRDEPRPSSRGKQGITRT